MQIFVSDGFLSVIVLNAKIMFIFLVSVFWSVAQKLILLDTSFLTSVYRSMIAQFASQKQKKYCRFNCKRSAKRWWYNQPFDRLFCTPCNWEYQKCKRVKNVFLLWFHLNSNKKVNNNTAFSYAGLNISNQENMKSLHD